MSNPQRLKWDWPFLATLVLLAAALVLGGASRLHELRLSVVELSALPLMIIALDALVRRQMLARHKLALGICCALVMVPLLQLVPLPSSLWTQLPGRSELTLALDLAGLSPGLGTLSVSPDRTWRSFLALIPPIAMFCGTLVLRSEDRLRITQILLLAITASVMLGALQLASGSTKFYLWRTTDAGSVVGFFANRNHLATLCLIAVPFTVSLAGRAIRRNGQRDRMVMWLSALMLVVLMVAIAAIRSRAGVALFFPVVAISMVAAWIASGRGKPAPVLLGLFAAVATALTAIAFFALGPILARFDATSAQEGRFENWPVVAEAANTYLPVGSGIGSFNTVYRSVEPLERLDPTFFNQAHNDYLELWLETGWVGAAILGAFLVWFFRRSWAAWLGGGSTARTLQRAATIAIAAVMAHSFIDYPLRTLTISTIFAFCCALLELAGQPDEERTKTRRRVNDVG